MWPTILAGVYAGIGAGAILTFLSYVAPHFGAGSYVRDLDPPTISGRKLSKRETQIAGLLIHLGLSSFFGAGYAAGVEYRLFPDFLLLPILGWGLVMSLAVGLIVMPLEGHGFFGRKHDAWFMVDAVITNTLWALLFFALIRIWVIGA